MKNTMKKILSLMLVALMCVSTLILSADSFDVSAYEHPSLWLYPCVDGWIDHLYNEGYEFALCDGQGLDYELLEIPIWDHEIAENIVAPQKYYIDPDTKEGFWYGIVINSSLNDNPKTAVVPKARYCHVWSCVSLIKLNVDDAGRETYVGECPLLTEIAICRSETIEIYDCAQLRNVTVTDYVKELYIKNCDSLESLTLPEGVETIEIENCGALINIKFPDSLKNVIIKDCDGLKNITIHKDIKEIKVEDCDGLSKVEIAEGATKFIADFERCHNISELIIPKSYQEFFGANFYSAGLKDIYYQGTEKEWENMHLYPRAFPYGVTIHCSDGIYDNCSCICHGNGMLWKIVRFIVMMLGIYDACKCNIAHY